MNLTSDEGVVRPPGSSPAAGWASDTPAPRLVDALISLKRQITDVRLVLPTPGVDEAVDEQRDMIDQIESYLLPRLRRGSKPLLVCVAGSTGAGKSTLVNSLVGAQVSNTGVRRPTTNSPVLACHPDDMVWFGEDRFLPTLPRVRQQGLAMPGRENMLVLAGLEQMPKGLALLDTPDIDSVVKAHHEFARQFLDAADVWLFVTTAARYADAAVWQWLQRGHARDAFLAVALSRVPSAGRPELEAHFTDMLQLNGLGEAERFYIPETRVEGGALPAGVSQEVRQWIDALTHDEDRRVAIVGRTLGGTLDSLHIRVPELARQVDAQLDLAADLREQAERAYADAVTEIGTATADGSLLHGEILARWQDFAGTGDLFRAIQARRGRGHRKERRRGSPGRLNSLADAVRTGVASLVEVHARSVDAWQSQVRRLVESHAVAKRSVARLVSFDDEALAVAFTVGILAPPGSAAAAGPLRLLRSLFGAAQLREVGASARADLLDRVVRLFDEESMRFTQLIDAAGVPDDDVAVRLTDAAYNLEGTR